MRGHSLFITTLPSSGVAILVVLIILLHRVFVARSVDDPTTKSDKYPLSRFYTQHRLWDKLVSTQLLGAFFGNARPPSTADHTFGGISDSCFSKRTGIPPLIHVLQNSATEDSSSSSFWNVETPNADSPAGVFTFFDDPVCESFVFGSGLFVCGDAMIRNALVVTSGVNATELLVHSNPQKTRSRAYMERCVVDSRQPSLTNHEPDNTAYSNGINTRSDEMSSSWCYKDLTIRSAQVYVLGRVEVAGNLVASSVRVEMGSSLFVGLRGLVYSNPRLNKDPAWGLTSRLLRPDASSSTKAVYPREGPFSNTMPDASRRDRLSRLVQLTQPGAVPPTDPPDASSMSAWGSSLFKRRTRRLYHSEDDHRFSKDADQSWGPSPSFVERSSARPSTADPPYHLLAPFCLTKEELTGFSCPLIDFVSGSIAQTASAKNQSSTAHTEGDAAAYNSHASAFAEDVPAAKTPQMEFSRGSTYFAGYSSPVLSSYGSLHRPPLWGSDRSFRDQAERAAMSASLSDAETRHDDPHLLPSLPPDVAIGDLITLRGHFILDAGAMVWVYGNVKTTKGIHVRTGSALHLHCGQLVTNVSYGAGLSANEGSVVSSGGSLESVFPRVLLQHGSHLFMAGSLIATRYLQALSSSVVEILGELLASVVAFNQASRGRVHDALEIETLFDVSDASEVTLLGNLGVGFLQVTDGSKLTLSHTDVGYPSSLDNRSPSPQASGARNHAASVSEEAIIDSDELRQVAIVEDSLLVDSSAHVVITGVSLLVYSNIYVANRSRLHLHDGDIFLENSGSIHIVGSQLLVNGHCVAPYGALLVGLGSSVRVTGHVRTAGRTALDDPYEPVGTSSWSSHKAWNLARAPVARNRASPAIPPTSSSTSPRAEPLRNDTSVFAVQPRPAVFVEDSQVVIEGTLEALNGWVEFTRRSSVTVGGEGLITFQPNHSFVHVHLGSTLHVHSGTVLAGLALLISTGGHVRTERHVPVISTGGVDVTDTSVLTCHRLRTFGDLHIAGNSKVTVTEDVIVGGNLLSVATRSTLTCQDVRQRRGDVFVANGGHIQVVNGSVWAYGSIVSQSHATLKITNGSLTAVQGDVVSENLSHIDIDGPLLLFSAYYAQQKIRQDPSLHPNDGPTFNDSLRPPSAARAYPPVPSNTTATFTDASKDWLLIRSMGQVRRTRDSDIISHRIIPATSTIQLYEQRAVPNLQNNGSTEDTHDSNERMTARGTTVEDQQVRLRQKEHYAQQLERPTTWETLTYYQKTPSKPPLMSSPTAL